MSGSQLLKSKRKLQANGQIVDILVNEEHQSGVYEIAWDGKNRNGFSLASGIYFCRLIAGDFKESKKFLFVE